MNVDMTFIPQLFRKCFLAIMYDIQMLNEKVTLRILKQCNSESGVINGLNPQCSVVQQRTVPYRITKRHFERNKTPFIETVCSKESPGPVKLPHWMTMCTISAPYDKSLTAHGSINCVGLLIYLRPFILTTVLGFKLDYLMFLVLFRRK